MFPDSYSAREERHTEKEQTLCVAVWGTASPQSEVPTQCEGTTNDSTKLVALEQNVKEWFKCYQVRVQKVTRVGII